jgi:hypothetical protein
MSPNDQGRHCAVCEKTVVDLTPLTVGERRERLAGISQELRQGKRVCVRGRVDRDGSLAGSRRLLTGGMALLLAVTFAGCQGEGPQVDTANQPQQVQPAEHQPLPGEATIAPPPMGIMAPITGSPAPVEPPHVLRGDVAEPLPAKMGETICPAPAPMPVTMGKIAAPAR